MKKYKVVGIPKRKKGYRKVYKDGTGSTEFGRRKEVDVYRPITGVGKTLVKDITYKTDASPRVKITEREVTRRNKDGSVKSYKNIVRKNGKIVDEATTKKIKYKHGGPHDPSDNFTNEELTDYGNMQINVGDYDQGYYGDKHRQKTNKIYTSLNQLNKLFTEGQLNAINGEWDYNNQIDAQGIYDDESENLLKRYQGLENLMKLNFGDRKGDPTRAKDWMNRDGRRYRKSLRALESDIQDLYLRRMEQYGKNTGVTSYGDNVQYDYVKSTDPEDKIYDDVTGEWTGEYRDKAIPRKAVSYDNKDEINFTQKGITNQIKRTSLNTSNVNDRKYIAQQIAEKGYVPKQYAIEVLDSVVYAKDKDKERQEKLTAEAERLFIEGAEQGYLPSSAVPIGGKIEDLRSFIKDQKKAVSKNNKNKDDFSRQKKKDAKFLNISADLLGTVEGEKLVRERLKTASDEDQRFLVNLYQKYFSDYDPNAVQFTQEEVNEMQEGFKGKARGSKELDYMSIDNPTGIIQDIAATTAYLAPAVATGQAFFNPTIQNILTPYFFYEAVKEDGILEQAVDEFSKGEYWDGTVDAGFGLLDVMAFKGLAQTLKTPGAVTRFFSKLKSKNLPKGYLEKINTSLPPMLQLDNIDNVPRNLNLPSATKSVKNTSNEVFADIIPGMDDADIPLDVNEALVKLTDEQFKKITGTDKWVYQMFVDKDPASAARNFKGKVDNASRNRGVEIIHSAESFAKVADEGKMPFTDIVKIKTAANDGKQKAIDWVSSDQFIQRVMDSRGVSREKAELIQMEFLNNIENIPFTLKAYDSEARAKAVFTRDEAGQPIVLAHAPKVEGFESSNIRQLEDLTGSLQHEYLHAANLASGKNMKGIEFLPDLKIPEGAKPIVRKNIAYLNDEPEQQVRAVKAIQLAQEAGVMKANEKFTVDKLNKLRDYIEEEGWLFGVAGYGDLDLLLDPIKSGNTFKDKDIVNLLNTAYQYALPLIGGAGAAMLSDSDEDMGEMSVAAIPLLIFGKNSKGAKAFKKAIKGLRNFLMTPKEVYTGIQYTSRNRVGEIVSEINLKNINELTNIAKKLPEGQRAAILNSLTPNLRKRVVDSINDLRKIKAGIKPDADEFVINLNAPKDADKILQGASQSTENIKTLLKNEKETGEISNAAIAELAEGDNFNQKVFNNLKNNPALTALYMNKYGNAVKEFASNNIKNPKNRELFLDEADKIVEEYMVQMLDHGTRQKIFRDTLDERIEILTELTTSGTYQGKRTIPQDKIKFMLGLNNFTNSNVDPYSRKNSEEILQSLLTMGKKDGSFHDDFFKDGELRLDLPLLDLPSAGSNLGDAQKAQDNWLIRNLNWAEQQQRDFHFWDNQTRGSGWEIDDPDPVFPQILNDNLTFSDAISMDETFEIMIDRLNKLMGNQTGYIDKNIKSIRDLEASDIKKEGAGLTQEGPLAKFFGSEKPLTSGESQIPNFKTGISERVSVRRGDGTKVSIKDGKLVKDEFKVGDDLASENLSSVIKENVNFIEETTGGKVFGSSQLAAMGVPTIPGDYDVLITEGDMLKNVIPNEAINTDNVDLNSEYAQKLKIDGQDTDFMIIKNGSDGLVQPKYRGVNRPSVEEELFRQFFPEEYAKATKNKADEVIDVIADKSNYVSKSVKLKIPLTAEELIAGVDPEIKTILDAFTAGSSRTGSKAKHTLKSEAVLLFANPEKIIKAQELHIKSLAGPDAKVAPDFIEFFGRKDEDRVDLNLDFLINRLGYTDDAFIQGETSLDIAKDPVRMQAFLNDWYINNTTTTRQIKLERVIDVVASRVKSGESFSVTNQNIIDALTEWTMEGGGGSASGAGLNVGVGIGDTAWGWITGFAQYKFPESGITSPQALVKNIKSKTNFGTEIPGNLKDKVDAINKKYGTDGVGQRYKTIGDLMQNSMLDFTSSDARQREWVKWYAEIGEALNTPFIRSKVTDNNTFGNLEFAGTTNQWETLGRSIGFSFVEDIESIKSLWDRKRALKKGNTKSFAINTKQDFYKIKNIFDLNQKELEDARRAILNAREKTNVEFIKSVNKVARLNASDSVKKVKEAYSEMIKFANKMESQNEKIERIYEQAKKQDEGRKKFKYTLKPWVQLAIVTLGTAAATTSPYWMQEMIDYIDEDGDGIIGTERSGRRKPMDKSIEVELTPEEVEKYKAGGYIVEEID